MLNQSTSSSNIDTNIQQEPEDTKIPTSHTAAPLAGPSLEKLKMNALIDPCLTIEEATLQARIQQHNPKSGQ